jgi:hypothetical protein
MMQRTCGYKTVKKQEPEFNLFERSISSTGLLRLVVAGQDVLQFLRVHFRSGL